MAVDERAVTVRVDAEILRDLPLAFAADTNTGAVKGDRAAHPVLEGALAVVADGQGLVDPGVAEAGRQVDRAILAGLDVLADLDVEQLILEAGAAGRRIDGID